MDKTRYNTITNLFRYRVKEIFGSNLVFAFIGGSFAKFKMRRESDIDMFICINKKDDIKKNNFIKWYLKIHKDNGLKPDKRFFAEVVTIKELDTALKYIKNYKPTFLIQERKLYDAFIWIGMIIASKIGFIGQKKPFIDRKKKAREIIRIWRKNLAENLKNDSPDEFLKHVVKYEERL